MAKSYFYKEIVSSNNFLVNGAQIPWQGIGQDSGWIELDDEADKALVDELNKINGSRGVVKMSKEMLDAKKKQIMSLPSVVNSRSEQLRPTPMHPAKRPRVESVAEPNPHDFPNPNSFRTGTLAPPASGADDLAALLENNAKQKPAAPFAPPMRKKGAKKVEATA